MSNLGFLLLNNHRTGSNTDLGLEAARHLVRLGATEVLLAVRIISKGGKAAKDNMQSCHVPESTKEVWPLVMSNYDSIMECATRATRTEV